jgi:Chaperone of endosialidase
VNSSVSLKTPPYGRLQRMGQRFVAALALGATLENVTLVDPHLLNAHMGEHSITMSPAGVGDVIRWSAAGPAPAAASLDIGMSAGGNILAPTGLDVGAAGTLTLGGTTATGVTVGQAGVATTMPGGALTNSVDRATAGILAIGTTTATTLNLGGTASNTNLDAKTGGTISIGTAVNGFNSQTINIGSGSGSGSTITITSDSGSGFTLKGNVVFEDNNLATWLTNTAVASAVNFINIKNAATTVAPSIAAAGSDVNIGLTLTTKGNANFLVQDSTGATLFEAQDSASAVNFVAVKATATTVSPILSVLGSDANISLKIASKGTGTVFLLPGTDSTAAVVISNAALTNEFAIFDSTNGRMSIASGGSVTPRTTLDVDGTAGVQLGGVGQNFIAVFENSANASTAACASFWGGDDSTTSRIIIDFREAAASGAVVGSIAITTTATAFNTSSDARLKTGIVPTSKGLRDLLKIQVRDFAFKHDREKVLHTGFIAQELHPIAPLACTPPVDPNADPAGDHWQVDNSKLVPYCVRAIQELHERLERLETAA